MKPEHTPGPWSFEWSEHSGYDCMWSAHKVEGPDGEEIAQMHALQPRTHDRDERQEANARLIAAAPEMLAALRHVTRLLGMWKEDPECTCEDCVMLRPVYAAITKALGPDWQNVSSQLPRPGARFAGSQDPETNLNPDDTAGRG